MDIERISKPHRHWRVFYTWPRAEKKCEERLLRREVDVFLPKHEVWRQWKDRKKKVIEPLFNNYIFAHVDDQERLRVLQTDGIVRCVKFGDTLAEVTEDEIEQLKITQKDPKRLLKLDFPLPPVGTIVTVTEGPLRELKGEIVEHRGQTHVILRVPSIQQAIRINVPGAWIRKERSPYEKY